MMKTYFEKMLRKVRIPAAIGILLWPTVAMADPASALMLLGAALVKVGLAYVGYALIAGTIIYGTIDARRRARHAAEDAKREFNKNLQDRSQTILTQLPPWTVRYGRTIAGSTVVAVFTTDKSGVRQNGQAFTKKDAYKHIVYLHASHECAAINGYRINGIDVGELDDDGWAVNPVFRLSAEYGYSAVKTVEISPSGSHTAVSPVRVLKAYDKAVGSISAGFPISTLFYTGNIPNGLFTISGDGKTITNSSATITLMVTYVYLSGASTLRISSHLGSPTQTVDTFLNGLIPDKWTTNHRLRGRCYSVVTVDLENTDFQGGIPQFEADLNGKLLYDPRSATTAYSNNWAVVVRDWLNSIWGANADVADIDDASAITAANDSDASIPVSLRGYVDTSLWTFASSADGFSGINCTVAAASSVLTVTGAANVNTPFAIQKTGLSIVGASNRYLRIRIRRTAGFTWKGIVQYSTAGHGFSEAFYAVKAVGMKINGAYQEVVWDMHSLRSGANDWKDNTITGIAILLGESKGDVFQVDWVAVSNENTTTATQSKYVVNAMFTTDDNRESVLNDLVAAGAGTVYHSGQWVVCAGAWSSPVMTLNDTDLVGQIQIVQADAGLDELFNGVRATYFEAGSSTAKEAKPYSVTALVTEDGTELWQDLAFPYTDNEQRVQNLMRISVERVRSGQVIQYPASMRTFPLRIGDRVTVNSVEYGFSSKTYVVTDWNFGTASPVVLTLQEDAAAIWDLADQVVYDQTPNTLLNDPKFILPFLDTSITIQSGTNHLVKEADGSTTTRVFVQWPVLSTFGMEGDGSAVDIIWQRVLRDDPNTWRRISFPAQQGYGYLLGAVTGDTLVIGIRPRNSLGYSAEYIYITHDVVGESQPASDVTNFVATPFAGAILLQWDPCPDIDYFETEIRTGASWASGTTVFKGNASRYLCAQSTPANITYYIKHRDATGNESTNAASDTASSFNQDSYLNYDFTNGSDGWSNIASVGSGDPGASGGTYGLHVGTAGTPAYPRFVPIDTSRRYRVTGRVWTSPGSGGPIYVGVLTKDTSGNILGNVGGPTYAYCAASNFTMTGGWHTFSGEISGTQAIPSATIDPSKFFAGSVSAAPMAFPNTGYTGQFIIDYLVLEDITDAGMAAAQGFAIHRMWDFNSVTLEGWSLIGLSVSYSTKTAILITATTTDPRLVISGLSIPGATFDKIRMRVKRVVGTNWQGDLYYETTGGHSYSETYKLTIPADNQPSNIDWQILEWDLAKHGNAGAQSDWPASDIFSLRFDLSQGAVGDSFLIDWIAIGKVGEAFDPASVTNAQWVGRGVSVQGDVAVKSRPTNAWDSDVYSREQFYGGAVASASFNVEQGGLVMFGLNSDPLTDASYTSLDYAWYFEGSSARMRIFESGVDLGVIDASPASTDVYTVAYDGSNVIYMKNGAVMRSVAAAPGLSFFFDSSFGSANVGLRGMRFGAMSSNNWQSVGGAAKPSDYASADLYLVNDGNTTQQGNRLTKISGATAWDAGAHSKDGYLGGAACSIVVHNSETTTSYEKMFGLNDNPTTPSYTDINFAFYMHGEGGGVMNLYAYGEGSNIGGSAIGTAVDNDILAISYDGYKARWYKNGAVLFEQSIVNTTSKWYFDCSIVQVGEFLDRITFRPLSMVAGLQTGQITPGATYGGGANNYSVSGGTIASGDTSYSSGAQALGSFVAAGQACIIEQAVFTMILIFGASVVSYVEVQLSVTRDDGVGTIHSIVGYFPCVPSSSGSKCNLVLPGLYRDAAVPAAGTKNYTVSLTVYFFNSTGSAIAAGLGASITWSIRNVSNEFKV